MKMTSSICLPFAYMHLLLCFCFDEVLFVAQFIGPKSPSSMFRLFRQWFANPSPPASANCSGGFGAGGFFFFIFFKNKNFKNICLFWNISKIPPVAPHRATGLKCNFFFSNTQWGPWKKKALSPVGGATGACRPAHGRPPLGPAHGRGRGPVAPPGVPPYISSSPPLPSSFEPENSTKNPEKKRGVRRRKAAKPCRIQHLWSAG